LARFILLEVDGIPVSVETAEAVRKNLIADLPLPRLIDRYLADSTFFNPDRL